MLALNPSGLTLDYEKVLDAIPLAVFVVDDDVAVQYANAVALRLLGTEKREVLKRRGGDILHCIHAHENPDGCGRAPACRSCVIRNAVKACLSGGEIRRSRLKLQMVTDERTTELEMLITASILCREKNLAVLVLENISEITSLRQIVAICSYCRKIRDAQQEWHSVEAFFKHEVGLEFSHSICPTCVDTQFSMLRLRDQHRDESSSQ